MGTRYDSTGGAQEKLVAEILKVLPWVIFHTAYLKICPAGFSTAGADEGVYDSELLWDMIDNVAAGATLLQQVFCTLCDVTSMCMFLRLLQ